MISFCDIPNCSRLWKITGNDIQPLVNRDRASSHLNDDPDSSRSIGSLLDPALMDFVGGGDLPEVFQATFLLQFWSRNNFLKPYTLAHVASHYQTDDGPKIVLENTDNNFKKPLRKCTWSEKLLTRKPSMQLESSHELAGNYKADNGMQDVSLPNKRASTTSRVVTTPTTSASRPSRSAEETKKGNMSTILGDACEGTKRISIGISCPKRHSAEPTKVNSFDWPTATLDLVDDDITKDKMFADADSDDNWLGSAECTIETCSENIWKPTCAYAESAIGYRQYKAADSKGPRKTGCLEATDAESLKDTLLGQSHVHHFHGSTGHVEHSHEKQTIPVPETNHKNSVRSNVREGVGGSEKYQMTPKLSSIMQNHELGDWVKKNNQDCKGLEMNHSSQRRCHDSGHRSQNHQGGGACHNGFNRHSHCETTGVHRHQSGCSFGTGQHYPSNHSHHGIHHLDLHNNNHQGHCDHFDIHGPSNHRLCDTHHCNVHGPGNQNRCDTQQVEIQGPCHHGNCNRGRCKVCGPGHCRASDRPVTHIRRGSTFPCHGEGIHHFHGDSHFHNYCPSKDAVSPQCPNGNNAHVGDFRSVPCPDLKCQEYVPINDLLNHIGQRHPFTLWLGCLEDGYVAKQYWNINSEKNLVKAKYNTWVLAVWQYDGQSFIAVLTRTNRVWYSWVSIVGHILTAQKYDYKVAVGNNKNPKRTGKCTYTGMVRPIDQLGHQIIQSHNCFVATDLVIQQYLITDGLSSEKRLEGYDYRLPIEYSVTRLLH